MDESAQPTRRCAPAFSEQTESDFQECNGRDWASRRTHRRLEAPVANSVESFFFESKSRALHHFDVGCAAVGIDYRLQNYCSLILGFARIFGILGFRTKDAARITDAASPRPEGAATG